MGNKFQWNLNKKMRQKSYKEMEFDYRVQNGGRVVVGFNIPS